MHTVFGEVTEGMDVLMKINESFVDKDFVPYQDIRYELNLLQLIKVQSVSKILLD